MLLQPRDAKLATLRDSLAKRDDHVAVAFALLLLLLQASLAVIACALATDGKSRLA